MGVKSTGNNHFKDGSNQSFFVRSGGKLIEFASNVFVTGDESIAGTNEYPTGVSGGTVFNYNGKTIHAFTSSGMFIISGAAVINKTCEMVMLGGGGGSTPSYTDEQMHLNVVDVANVLVDIVHARVEQ